MYVSITVYLLSAAAANALPTYVLEWLILGMFCLNVFIYGFTKLLL